MRLPCTLITLAIAIGLGCVSALPVDAPDQRFSVGEALVDNRSGGPKGRAADTESSRCLSAEQLAARVLAAVVDIHTDTNASPAVATGRPQETARQSTGSGVVIAADGWILTSEHVVRNASVIAVALADGTRHTVTRMAVHPQLDLAVLHIDCHDLTPLRFVNRPARTGTRVMALAGAAFCEQGPARTGIITQTQVSLQQELDPRRVRCYDRLIESTTQIEPGFSGGPLVDGEGNVVGINVAVSGEGTGPFCRGYAIPLHAATRNTVADLIDQAHTMAGRPVSPP